MSIKYLHFRSIYLFIWHLHMISWSPEWSNLGGSSQKAVARQHLHNTKAHCQLASIDHTSPESYTYPQKYTMRPAHITRKAALEASTLTMPLSTHWVTITRLCAFCSHTMRQKSSLVPGRGPCVAIYSHLKLFPC